MPVWPPSWDVIGAFGWGASTAEPLRFPSRNF